MKVRTFLQFARKLMNPLILFDKKVAHKRGQHYFGVKKLSEPIVIPRLVKIKKGAKYILSIIEA